MATNRFTNLSTASYKPLSFEEIMMVPMAKQKQHENSQAAADEYMALQSKSLTGDREEVTAELSKLRKEADSIAEQLNTKGVDPSIQRRLRQLKRNKEKQFGQEGLVGNAAANYEAVNKYLESMSTDEKMQAGWSPEEARTFAQYQVNQFGKTMNSDGTFNSFTGKNLVNKMDENEFLRKGVKDVAKDIKPETLRFIELNGLDAYSKAFREGSVDKVDYNTVMAHLSNLSKTTPSLMNHLKQQAFFTGEKNYDDFGQIEEVIKQDSNGKDYMHKQWVPGKSRYGMKMAGLGAVSSYRNVTESIRILKDPLASEMIKRGLNEDKMLNLLTFNDGEVNQMTVESLETLENTNKLYGEQKKELHEGIIKYKSNVVERLKASNPKLEGRALDDAANEVLSNDREYSLLKKDYEDVTVNHNNTSLRLDSMSSKIEVKPEPHEEIMLQTKSMIESSENSIQALESLNITDEEIDQLNEIMNDQKWGLTYRVRDDLNRIKNDPNLSVEERNNIANDYLYKFNYLRSDENLVKYGSTYTRNFSANQNYSKTVDSYNNKRQGKIDNYFKNNPKAGHFTILNGPASGDYSSFTGAAAKQLGLDFKTSAINTKQLAYGKGLLMDDPGVIALGESEKGFDYRVSPTDGYDDDGNHFNNVIVENLSDNTMTSVQVIDNRNNTVLNGIADEYAKGSFEQKQIATQIKAKIEYMKKIKSSGSIYQDNKFTVKLSDDLYNKQTGEGVSIDFIKKESTVTDRYRWIPSINGTPIEGGKPLYSETEVAVFLYELSNKKRMPKI